MILLSRRPTLLLFFVANMAIFTIQCAARAAPVSPPVLIADQQNLVGGSTGGAQSPDFILGQSFIPALNGIDAIELNIRIHVSPAQMRITLLDGVVGIDGLQGPVIGTTQTVTITETIRRTFRFEFPTTVPLTPGNSYVLRFEPIGPDSNPQIEINGPARPNPYARGQLLQLRLPKEDKADQDFTFVEGVYRIPEPPTTLLVLCAIAGVLISRWRDAE